MERRCLSIGAMFFLLNALLGNEVRPLYAFAAVVSLGGVTFAFLQGTVAFLLLAGGSFAIWFAAYAGEKARIVDVPYIIKSILFGIGMHEGNNINASGGILDHYAALLSVFESGEFFSVGDRGEAHYPPGYRHIRLYVIYRDAIGMFR